MELWSSIQLPHEDYFWCEISKTVDKGILKRVLLVTTRINNKERCGMGLNNREYKEFEKLQKKSGFTKLSVSEQRRLEKLNGLLSNEKKAVAKDK